MTKSELLDKIYRDSFLSSYFETALWSSVDDEGVPIARNYDFDSFTADALRTMIADCDGFLEMPGVDDAIGLDYDQAGHDFWLTRNGHGAGFWDGDWPEPEATLLTDAAHSWGSQDIYVHRGRLYV